MWRLIATRIRAGPTSTHAIAIVHAITASRRHAICRVLVRPDGVRATSTFFLPSNNRQEFDPAWGAFNVSSETGDYLTFDVDSSSVLVIRR